MKCFPVVSIHIINLVFMIFFLTRGCTLKKSANIQIYTEITVFNHCFSYKVESDWQTETYSKGYCVVAMEKFGYAEDQEVYLMVEEDGSDVDDDAILPESS